MTPKPRRRRRNLTTWADKDWANRIKYGVVDNEIGYSFHTNKNKYNHSREERVKVRITIEEL